MEAEDTYRSAWQGSPLAIVTLDAQGYIRSCNPACERLFARERSLLERRTLDAFVHPFDRGALRQMIAEGLDGRVPTRQEIRFHRPGEVVVVTGFSVAPDTQGDGGVCILRDLSREQAFRPQLLHTERMASIGVVASVVAHELNNALAGAMGCLQLLPPPSDPSTEELFDSLAGELRRSAEIVRELKGYARVEDGLSDDVDPAELLARVERLGRYHRAEKGSATIVCEIEDDLPTLHGNTNQLLQALLNLVRNAEQAVSGQPDERKTIVLRASSAHDVLILEVADRGPGIPVPLRARLFEPFYSTKPTGEGTGLGLTVVQAVAAGHGGRIEVDETPGGGATFRLVLPCPATAPVQTSTSHRTRAALHYPALHGMRLLVADDEPIIRRVVERACADQGVIVASADHADAAEALLAEQPFDLVLLDVRMPGGGGARIFRTLRAQHPQLIARTVFMSGEIASDMTQVVGQGYAGVLHKPFDLHQLLDALDAARQRSTTEEPVGPTRGR